MVGKDNSTQTSVFKNLILRYISFNDNFLYKKSLYYLTAQDLDISSPPVGAGYCILTLSQLGVLYNIDKDIFTKNRFDNQLLTFFSRFRDRLSFVFNSRTNHYEMFSKNTLNLIRIVITETSPEERSEIDSFMAQNTEIYSKYVRQTTNYDKNIDYEKIIDIRHMDMICKLPDKIKYKDLVVIFGY
jgi:hypothetical protein